MILMTILAVVALLGCWQIGELLIHAAAWLHRRLVRPLVRRRVQDL